MKNFQLILIIIFIFGGVLGIFVFAGFINLDDAAVNQGPTGTVVFWGTLPSSVVSPLIEEFNRNRTYNVRYVSKRVDTFDQELLEAIALGQGPDLFLVSNDSIYKHINKVAVIPYANYPLVNFKNNFAQAGEVFLSPQGILALPLTIDPTVMYYNRSILDQNSTPFPPAYWDELNDYAQKFTKKNEEGSIIQSAFALGQYANISNAKEILATLFLQVGNPIISNQRSFFRANLSQYDENKENPVKVLDFFTSFSNPTSSNYTWNKGLPLSIDAFSREDLVFYFGAASDLRNLIARNPNQNFQVAQIPQYRNTDKTTFAKVSGLAMSNFSKNKPAATDALYSLVSGNFANTFSARQYLPPARRDLLGAQASDAYFPVFYSSALFAKSWMDPSYQDSDNIFRSMVEQILSNQRNSESSILSTNNRLNILLNN